MAKIEPLDKIDRALLTALEQEARTSYGDLGEKIGLSKTPTWSRVRELEKRSVITGYKAQIDPGRVGLELHAFVQVTITGARHTQFEAAVLRHHSILECFAIAGLGDYLMHVLVAGIAELDRLLREDLSRMPGVQRLTTTVAMKTIKHRASIMDCAENSQRVD